MPIKNMTSTPYTRSALYFLHTKQGSVKHFNSKTMLLLVTQTLLKIFFYYFFVFRRQSSGCGNEGFVYKIHK